MDPRTGNALGPGDYGSPLAPAPPFPEKTPTFYERKLGATPPMNRGPLRFEEGIATDTDVPNDFTVGAMQGYATAPGRINRNQKVDTKWAEETVAQRAHVGSASWVEAPTFLGEFAHGSFSDYSEIEYEQSIRDGMSYRRMNPATVVD